MSGPDKFESRKGKGIRFTIINEGHIRTIIVFLAQPAGFSKFNIQLSPE